jgi:Mn-dependent DtxR family transcriptional regulator
MPEMIFKSATMASVTREQSFLQTRSRVANHLLEKVRNRFNGNHHVTQRDIASDLGIGWCTVHLCLKSLNYDGIIKIDRNRLVLDEAQLQLAAEPAR